jgi:hypothetical protein
MSKAKAKVVKRTSVLLRLDSSLAEWYANAAKKQGRSRAKMMEMWLSALREEVEKMDAGEGSGAVKSLGELLTARLIQLGMANDALLHDYHETIRQREEMLKWIEEDNKAKGRK